VDNERVRLKNKLLELSKKRIKIAKEYTVSFTYDQAVQETENALYSN